MNDRLPLLRFNSFDGAAAAVSTRHGGVSEGRFQSLNLSLRVGDDPLRVVANRERLLEAAGRRPGDAVMLAQVHSARVALVDAGDRGRGLYPGAPPPHEADAAITREPCLALVVVAADCVPILFWDRVRRAVGAAHAGWRGTAAGIAPRVVEAMGEAFGSRPQDLLVGLGPAIGPCCYEVDAPVLDALRQSYPQHLDRVARPCRPGHAMLDLQEQNRLELIDAGVQAEQIEVLRLCTSCRTDLLYSERAEGRPSGRFGGLIAVG